MTDVTILGLGKMGAKLAELLLVDGRKVTVWNRTASAAVPLGTAGADIALTAAAAVAASPIAIACVANSEALWEILASDGVEQAIGGRLLVDLGTSGPDQVRATASWLAERGARYLDGAIQAAPSQMGQPDTPVLIAGPSLDLAAGEDILRVLGGNLVHVGEAIDAASHMDLATLAWVYGAFAGFLQGALIAEAVGVDVGAYGRLVQAISPSFGAFFRHEGEVIQSGDFTITESPLRISIPATARIARICRELKVDAALPDLVNGWLQQADRAGLAGEEIAALIKVLRETAPAAAVA